MADQPLNEVGVVSCLFRLTVNNYRVDGRTCTYIPICRSHREYTAPESVTKDDKEFLDRLAPADPRRCYVHGDQSAHYSIWGVECFPNLKPSNEEPGFALERVHVGVNSTMPHFARAVV